MNLDGFEERHMRVWLQKHLADSNAVHPAYVRMKSWLEGLSDEDCIYWLDRGWPDIYVQVMGKGPK